MRRAAPLLVCLMPLAAWAESGASLTVRDAALQLALNMARQEMQACAAAHPARAERYLGGLDKVPPRLAKALADMVPQRGQELALVLPNAVAQGQALMLALQAADPAPRTAEFCDRTAREIVEVRDDEAAALMGELVTTLARGGMPPR